MITNTQKFLIFREYKKFCEEYGYPPTQRELANKVGKSHWWVGNNTRGWLEKCDGIPFYPKWKNNIAPDYYSIQEEKVEPVDEHIKKGILPNERTYYNSE